MAAEVTTTAENVEAGGAGTAPGRTPAVAGRDAARTESSLTPALVVGGRILTILAALALWQLFSGRVLPDYSISNPVDVAKVFGTMVTTHDGWVNIGVTSKEIGAGFAIGVAAGTVGGLVLGSLRVVGMILEPLISAINGIPKIALAPVFVLILGIGTWTDAVIAGMMVSLIVFYGVYTGMRTVSPELVSAVKLLGGNRRKVLLYVTMPSVLAPFVGALKAAAPFAVLGVIIGEFVASFQGVGHVLSNASTSLDAAQVYAAVVVLVLMGLVLNAVLSAVDRWATRRLGMAPKPARRLAAMQRVRPGDSTPSS